MMKILKILIVATGIFSFGVTKSVSQTNVTKIAELFNARTHVSMQKDTMQYRLLKPIDYDSTKQYPLVVCLSGGAGRGTDNIKQIAGSRSAQVLSTLENRKKYPAFVFVPQCPPGSDWGRSLGKIERESRIKRGKDNQPSVESLVFEIISALEEEFNIDTTRRYITGQSMGGFGSWHFILTHPQMFAAAIPICGGANPDLAKNITDVPIWVFHGENDNTIPVDFSRNMIAAIKKAGGNPKYNEFPNVGHGSWHLAYDTPELLDWLFVQVNEKKLTKDKMH
jgi:predicted peptidase